MENEPHSNQAVLRFVEQFALLLTDAQMPRMAARVFSYMLVDDADRYTAGELAAGLQVSPAAVSGAVRHLLHAGLVVRDREPGAAADSYRVHDDAWSSLITQSEEAVKRTESLLTGGLELLDQNASGSRRVREALEYFRFWRVELPRMLERWREHKRMSVADRAGANRM